MEKNMTNFITNNNISAALTYATRFNWRILPLHSIIPNSLKCTCGHSNCTSPCKHPYTQHGVHDATCDQKQISEWWQRWPHANVGIATGLISNGLLVIDIDPRHSGNESFTALIKTHGALPTTATVSTGGGGQHIYLCTNAIIANSAGVLGNGLDIRGNGGYQHIKIHQRPPTLPQIANNYRWRTLAKLKTSWRTVQIAMTRLNNENLATKTTTIIW